jgi:signal transduction histidine kinase
LRTAIDASPLLPASLGDGQVTNDRLFVEVQDNTGQVLIQDDAPYDNAVMVAKVMGDDYQGVVDGFRISFAVDPGTAGTLLIGGLPAEQLPLLAIVMALSVALLLTAIWLFRREQAVMQMRVDFVSQVSHELRTPLTQIRMFAETLLLDRARSPEEQQRSLQIIDRESRRLSHLVENILRFSSISDAVPVNAELQPLAPVLEEVCEATEMMHADVTVTRQVEESVAARFDDDALRQILLNLLDNAVKYGPNGQTVNVRVSQQGGVARVEIIDQGPGIPRAERDRVWDAFYRPARERITAISGAGIGLAVVRDLMHAMGGRCWFEEAATGAHVIIELPAEHDDG